MIHHPGDCVLMDVYVACWKYTVAYHFLVLLVSTSRSFICWHRRFEGTYIYNARVITIDAEINYYRLLKSEYGDGASLTSDGVDTHSCAPPNYAVEPGKHE